MYVNLDVCAREWGPNGDAFVCVDRTSSHKHARSRLTDRCDLASVFHDVAPRVIRHDQDRQIRPWHSCGDPGDLYAEVDYRIRYSGTRAGRDRFHRKQRRGLNSASVKSRFIADKAQCCETKLSSDAVVHNESYGSWHDVAKT